MTTPETRGRWEGPGTDNNGGVFWTCRLCKQGLKHTKAEHALIAAATLPQPTRRRGQPDGDQQALVPADDYRRKPTRASSRHAR
jgi:hypothetical protein